MNSEDLGNEEGKYFGADTPLYLDRITEPKPTTTMAQIKLTDLLNPLLTSLETLIKNNMELEAQAKLNKEVIDRLTDDLHRRQEEDQLRVGLKSINPEDHGHCTTEAQPIDQQPADDKWAKRYFDLRASLDIGREHTHAEALALAGTILRQYQRSKA